MANSTLVRIPNNCSPCEQAYPNSSAKVNEVARQWMFEAVQDASAHRSH
jgi:hypothetical protein